MTRQWWVRWPGRLEAEFDALKAAGIRFTEVPAARLAGIVQVDLYYAPPGEDEIHLIATYPDAFPYTRPEVAAPDLDLKRHQHPFIKSLCLLPRGTENWDIDQTLASYITDRVPKVRSAVAAAEAGEPSPVPEQAQGEPYSDYYAYEDGGVVLIDSSWALDRSARGGLIDLVLDGGSKVLRGAVERIRDQRGAVLLECDPALKQVVANGRRLTGRWVRVDQPPPQDPGGRLSRFDDALVACDASLRRPRTTMKHGSSMDDVVAVVFDEEVGEGRWQDGWTFRVRHYEGHMPSRPYLVRAFRAGRDDLRERTPETRGLADKKVVVLGLGGVGTPAALELARAGVGELCLVDHDVVDAGPVVRYPFGLASVGRPKVEVVRNWILQNLPYTTASAAKHRLGGVRSPADIPEEEVIDLAFAGADLVLDTTAEFGLHVYVADLAREYGIPYVEATTRAGAWGGVVARVLPGDDQPCWICYEARLRDLEESGNGPAADPSGMTQPTGCADPTFTGVGFDVTEFGLAACRLVVSTLLRGEIGGYPDPGWDIAILNIRERDGSASQPTWTTSVLTNHPDCPRHGSHAA